MIVSCQAINSYQKISVKAARYKINRKIFLKKYAAAFGVGDMRFYYYDLFQEFDGVCSSDKELEKEKAD